MATSYQPRAPLVPANTHRIPLASNHQNTPHKADPLRTTAKDPRAGHPPSKSPNEAALKRQAPKIAPPTPPRIIVDKTKQSQYQRISFLGEGGFARVYEVQNTKGHHLACKVVTKESLKSKKAKTKLYAEIKIHKSLNHPNIVGFKECFEDSENVYMTLELCTSGSLMDILRRRKSFTEQEARFYTLQLLGACHYMHTHQVIHRDLKLGNIFLDGQMNIKLGDFGLAALIETVGERKKTICGTPNYIAPEVLFDQANGHSFEVDTWSIGVIIYTLIFGKPPFQTKEVKEIYKRIRDNEYEFPTDRPASKEVKALITKILSPSPDQRPSLFAIADDRFFSRGPVPGFIPLTANTVEPRFPSMSQLVSDANYNRLRQVAGLVDDDDIEIVDAPVEASSNDSLTRNASTSLAQQEKDFHKAIQPGSPISILLSSARQPLIVAGGANARRSPMPISRTKKASQKADDDIHMNTLGKSSNEKEERAPSESHKARIVQQMTPAPLSRPPSVEQENIPVGPREAQNHVPAPADLISKRVDGPSGFEIFATTLTNALDAKAQGVVYQDPTEKQHEPERVFIQSWVDYCNKYGMGYALSDGTVGVHFNDSTTMVLSPDKVHFDYVTSHQHGALHTARSYTQEEYPHEIHQKVYLLKHFEKYIMNKLYGEYAFTFVDPNRKRGMAFVQKYLRMKHVIVFKMSHGALQFNFYDHTKIILSAGGLHVAYIDKMNNLTHWRLSDIMERAVHPTAKADEAKVNARLVDKLRYCMQVLANITSASADQAAKDNATTSGKSSNTVQDINTQRTKNIAPSRIALR